MTSAMHEVASSMVAVEPSAVAISLVICTRNRADQLEACLAAVAKVRCDWPWEVVIVDNGSSDHTKSVTAAFLSGHPVRSHYVWEPKPGLGNARNAAVTASSGEI